MFARPVQARHLGEHRLLVIFDDGAEAELDFSPLIARGGVFAGFDDPARFGQVVVDPEAESLVWPGGVDICPDVLYHLATGTPLPGSLPYEIATVIRQSRCTSDAGV